MSFDLVSELQDKMQELDISIKRLRTSGTDWAEAERNYNVAFAKKVLELKDAGYPATLISKLAHGDKDIAELEFKLNIADVVYDANKRHSDATKKEMTLIDNQIQREWSNTHD